MEEAEPKRHSFSVAEFDLMVESGAFSDDARIELIEGELIDMPPPNPPHAASVASLQEALTIALHDRAHVRAQAPLTVGALSQPEPDLAVVRVAKDRYFERHPKAADAFAVIEVSSSSLAIDRGVKLRMYGRARIPEYWIVDLRAEVVEAYREPHDLGYGATTVYRRGDMLALQAFPHATLRVDDVLGTVKAGTS
ncbi:MAG TPA: Uma2 family endonuclease [Candidatus Baltobacteraceae bacterium]|nr:Uma2 family endonuclease [Candidatus Baltobacteraceae bacterium]